MKNRTNSDSGFYDVKGEFHKMPRMTAEMRKEISALDNQNATLSADIAKVSRIRHQMMTVGVTEGALAWYKKYRDMQPHWVVQVRFNNDRIGAIFRAGGF